MVADIDQTREHGNLSSAIRAFVLESSPHVRFNPESSINRVGGQDETVEFDCETLCNRPFLHSPNSLVCAKVNTIFERADVCFRW